LGQRTAISLRLDRYCWLSLALIAATLLVPFALSMAGVAVWVVVAVGYTVVREGRSGLA